MSSMSSAQIVSAGSAIHNKMPPALVGPLALHASTPVSYPGAVSPDHGAKPLGTNFFFLSLCFIKQSIFFFYLSRNYGEKGEEGGKSTRQRGKNSGKNGATRALGWDDETRLLDTIRKERKIRAKVTGVSHYRFMSSLNYGYLCKLICLHCYNKDRIIAIFRKCINASEMRNEMSFHASRALLHLEMFPNA